MGKGERWETVKLIAFIPTIGRSSLVDAVASAVEFCDEVFVFADGKRARVAVESYLSGAPPSVRMILPLGPTREEPRGDWGHHARHKFSKKIEDGGARVIWLDDDNVLLPGPHWEKLRDDEAKDWDVMVCNVEDQAFRVIPHKQKLVQDNLDGLCLVARGDVVAQTPFPDAKVRAGDWLWYQDLKDAGHSFYHVPSTIGRLG